MKHCNHSMYVMVIICISIHPLNVKMYEMTYIYCVRGREGWVRAAGVGLTLSRRFHAVERVVCLEILVSVNTGIRRNMLSNSLCLYTGCALVKKSATLSRPFFHMIMNCPCRTRSRIQ